MRVTTSAMVLPHFFPLPEDNIHIVSDLLVSESRPTSNHVGSLCQDPSNGLAGGAVTAKHVSEKNAPKKCIQEKKKKRQTCQAHITCRMPSPECDERHRKQSHP
jgi:hypothetical protein